MRINLYFWDISDNDMKDIAVLKIGQFQQETPDEPFYANTLADHLVSSHLHINKPHRHNFYAAMLFTKGSGTHDIDFNTYEVRPGSVFMLAPGQTHHWELSADADGFIFFHIQAFYDMHYIDDGIKDYPFFSSVQNAPAIYLKDTEPVAGLFKRLLLEHTADKLKKKQMILSLVTQIYIELSRQAISGNPQETVQSDHYLSKFAAFEKLVETHYADEKAPEQYAQWMNMTAKHLNRINKTIVNKTTSEVITERVLLEAKRMLIYSGNSFNEIAFALGYDDYAYFSRLFKKNTGETPTAFLRKHE